MEGLHHWSRSLRRTKSELKVPPSLKPPSFGSPADVIIAKQNSKNIRGRKFQ